MAETFKEFYIKRHGSWPGPSGMKYDDIFAGLCESFAAYVDEVVRRQDGWMPICESNHEGTVDLWGVVVGQMIPHHRITDCSYRNKFEQSGVSVGKVWLDQNDNEIEASYFKSIGSGP